MGFVSAFEFLGFGISLGFCRGVYGYRVEDVRCDWALEKFSRFHIVYLCIQVL